MKIFVFCSILFSVCFTFSQETIYVDIDSSFFQDSTFKNELVINKSASKPAIYIFRFQGIKIPKNAKKNVAYDIEWPYFPEENGFKRNLSIPSVFYTFKADSSGNLNSEYLELQVSIPASRFGIEDEILPISSSFLTESYGVKRAINLRIVYEQPDILSATQWEEGMLWSYKTNGVTFKGDHYEVYAFPPNSITPSTYKVQLKPTEKLEIFYRRNAISRLGLIHIPMKFIFSNLGVLPDAKVSFSNLGLSFGIANFSSAVYFPNGQVKHRSLGFGTFISPSIQNQVIVFPDNLFRVNAYFLGFGLTFNYSVNGLGFHLIPFAYDLFLNTEYPSQGLNSGGVFMGFGIGYQPFFNRKY